MEKKLLSLSLLLFFFLFLPLPVQAFALLPAQDTYVDSAYPDLNYGQEKEIKLGFTASSQIVFLKFDLENLTLTQPEEEVILSLPLQQSNSSLEPIKAEVLLPDQAWEENKITWNNKPALFQSGLTAVFEATPGAQKINLTPVVRQWLDQNQENHGLALYCNSTSFWRQFASKENQEDQPVLKVVASTAKTKKPTQAVVEPLASASPITIKVKSASQTAQLLAEAQPEEKPQQNQKQTKKPHFSSLLANKNLTAVLLWLLALAAFGSSRLLEMKK